MDEKPPRVIYDDHELFRGPVPAAVVLAVWDQARGVRQRGLLNGSRSWTGKDLTSWRWSFAAKRERQAFVDKIDAALPGDWGFEVPLVRAYKRFDRTLRVRREPVLVRPDGQRVRWFEIKIRGRGMYYAVRTKRDPKTRVQAPWGK